MNKYTSMGVALVLASTLQACAPTGAASGSGVAVGHVGHQVTGNVGQIGNVGTQVSGGTFNGAVGQTGGSGGGATVTDNSQQIDRSSRRTTTVRE